MQNTATSTHTYAHNALQDLFCPQFRPRINNQQAKEKSKCVINKKKDELIVLYALEKSKIH